MAWRIRKLLDLAFSFSSVEVQIGQREHRVDHRILFVSFPSRLIPMALRAVALFLSLFLAWPVMNRIRTNTLLCAPSPTPQWAQYSPYSPLEVYQALPQGCEVVQVSSPSEGV